MESEGENDLWVHPPGDAWSRSPENTERPGITRDSGAGEEAGLGEVTGSGEEDAEAGSVS